MAGAFGVISAVAFFAISAALFHHYVVRVHTAGAWLSKGAILVDVDSAGEFCAEAPGRRDQLAARGSSPPCEGPRKS